MDAFKSDMMHVYRHKYYIEHRIYIDIILDCIRDSYSMYMCAGSSPCVSDAVIRWLYDSISYRRMKRDTDERVYKRCVIDDMIDGINMKIQEYIEDREKKMRLLFKNYVVMKKCDNMRGVTTRPVRCRICTDVIDVDLLADHSFQCLETKILRTELDKINRMIIKLKNSCAKVKSKIRI